MVMAVMIMMIMIVMMFMLTWKSWALRLLQAVVSPRDLKFEPLLIVIGCVLLFLVAFGSIRLFLGVFGCFGNWLQTEDVTVPQPLHCFPCILVNSSNYFSNTARRSLQ